MPISKTAILGASTFAAISLLGALPTLAQTPAGPARNDYADGKTWLCRPGRQDACTVDLDATVVKADGSTSVEKFQAAADPKIDCFYVYPTVSNDPTPNSDMNAGPEEISVIKHQFARMASVCRTYAPLYRQVTLSALRARMLGKPMAGVDPVLGYNDVKAAWNYYLEHDNKGRGVVLIGHSQGSGVLTQLVKNEAHPVEDHLGHPRRLPPASAGGQGCRRRFQVDPALPQRHPDRLRDEFRLVPGG
jgi:hypothetical protein